MLLLNPVNPTYFFLKCMSWFPCHTFDRPALKQSLDAVLRNISPEKIGIGVGKGMHMSHYDELPNAWNGAQLDSIIESVVGSHFVSNLTLDFY